MGVLPSLLPQLPFNSIVDLHIAVLGLAAGASDAFNSIVDLRKASTAYALSPLTIFQFYSRSS